MNWKILKWSSIGIMALTAVVLLFPSLGGLPGLNDTFYQSPFTFGQILGAGLAFSIWAFNKLIRG